MKFSNCFVRMRKMMQYRGRNNDIHTFVFCAEIFAVCKFQLKCLVKPIFGQFVFCKVEHSWGDVKSKYLAAMPEFFSNCSDEASCYAASIKNSFIPFYFELFQDSLFC